MDRGPGGGGGEEEKGSYFESQHACGLCGCHLEKFNHQLFVCLFVEIQDEVIKRSLG